MTDGSYKRISFINYWIDSFDCQLSIQLWCEIFKLNKWPPDSVALSKNRARMYERNEEWCKNHAEQNNEGEESEAIFPKNTSFACQIYGFL